MVFFFTYFETFSVFKLTIFPEARPALQLVTKGDYATMKGSRKSSKVPKCYRLKIIKQFEGFCLMGETLIALGEAPNNLTVSCNCMRSQNFCARWESVVLSQISKDEKNDDKYLMFFEQHSWKLLKYNACLQRLLLFWLFSGENKNILKCLQSAKRWSRRSVIIIQRHLCFSLLCPIAVQSCLRSLNCFTNNLSAANCPLELQMWKDERKLRVFLPHL